MDRNIKLKQLESPIVKKIDDYFLYNNKCLKRIYLPMLLKLGAFSLNLLDTSLLEELVVSDKIDIGKYFNEEKQKTMCLKR